MFGRAIIRLGIGPHSSLVVFVHLYLCCCCCRLVLLVASFSLVVPILFHGVSGFSTLFYH